VVTGGHGREVNETRTNAWGHSSNFLQWQTRVPLLVLWPGKKPETHTHRTTHWVIVPSLMSDALGVPAPPRYFSSGKKLWDVSGPPFSSWRAITKPLY
jgi:membrane-anchored protein YejM (alkaline phosphatase superfamily)